MFVNVSCNNYLPESQSLEVQWNLELKQLLLLEAVQMPIEKEPGAT
jgi:hypothetical protein